MRDARRDRATAVVLTAACGASVAAWGAVAVARTGDPAWAAGSLVVLAAVTAAGLAAAVTVWWRDQARTDARLDDYEASVRSARIPVRYWTHPERDVDAELRALAPDLRRLDDRTLELPVMYAGAHRGGRHAA